MYLIKYEWGPFCVVRMLSCMVGERRKSDIAGVALAWNGLASIDLAVTEAPRCLNCSSLNISSGRLHGKTTSALQWVASVCVCLIIPPIEWR